MILLGPEQYDRVAPLLRGVPINNFFARAVVEGHVAGRVFADDPDAPRACYVAHPYGMSLLFGAVAGERFDAGLRAYLLGQAPVRHSAEWLQAYPAEWTGRLGRLLAGHLEAPGRPDPDGRRAVVEEVRVNFRFDRAAYAGLRGRLALPEGCSVVSDAELLYRQMEGSVVPAAFWDSAEQFRRTGAAFAVACEGELASTAFASFVMDRSLELGIETHPRFRGRGLAVHACSALIDHCIAHGLEPVWACRLGNTGSYRLARKLGFEHVLSLPYYRLPVTAPSAAPEPAPAAGGASWG